MNILVAALVALSFATVPDNPTLSRQCTAIALAKVPEPLHTRAGSHVAHWAWQEALAMEIRACEAGRSHPSVRTPTMRLIPSGRCRTPTVP